MVLRFTCERVPGVELRAPLENPKYRSHIRFPSTHFAAWAPVSVKEYR